MRALKEWDEYLVSKGWTKGEYRYPDIPGEVMYRLAHPKGKMCYRTLCQAMKVQMKLDHQPVEAKEV